MSRLVIDLKMKVSVSVKGRRRKPPNTEPKTENIDQKTENINQKTDIRQNTNEKKKYIVGLLKRIAGYVLDKAVDAGIAIGMAKLLH